MSFNHSTDQSLAAFVHPELLPGEVFVSNTTPSVFDTLTLQTKRRGTVAYDGNGGLVSSTKTWVPVFAKESEFKENSLSLPEMRRAILVAVNTEGIQYIRDF